MSKSSYSSPDGLWSVAYPAAWEVSSSRDSRAAAFLLPVADLGSGRFRPSLVVSAAPLYFVVGVSTRQHLYTAVGTTSPALPEYRQQAAQFRDVLVSLRAR